MSAGELRAMGERLRNLSHGLRRWAPNVVGQAITGMTDVANRLDALADDAERCVAEQSTNRR